MTRRGFTLIEVLLVMSIVGIIGMVSVIFSLRLLRANDLDIAVRRTLDNIRIAQIRAQLVSENSAWGVYATANSVTLFRGSSYATRDQAQDTVTTLSPRITVTGLQEVVFAPISGTPSQSGLITFTHADITQPKYIFVNVLGLAEKITEGQKQLTVLEDASFHQGSPSSNQGGTAILEVYPRNIGYNKRAVVVVPLSRIPASATITQATLYLKQAQTYGSTRTIGIHRLTRAWSEAEATWSRASSSTVWSSGGGDFVANATDTETLTWGGTLQWSTWNVTNDVQAMVNGTASNYGWLLKDATEDNSEAYWYFSSREGAAPPYLVVDYAL